MNHVLGEDLPAAATVVFTVLGLATAVAAARELEPVPVRQVVVKEKVEVPVEVPLVIAPVKPECAPGLDVPFDVGSSHVPDFDAGRLVTWLDAHPTDRVQIDGHADPRGSVADNLALSERRARHVAARLVALKVARDRMEVRGFGAYATRQRSVTVRVADRATCEGGED